MQRPLGEAMSARRIVFQQSTVVLAENTCSSSFTIANCNVTEDGCEFSKSWVQGTRVK